jgi:hypothetical protein
MTKTELESALAQAIADRDTAEREVARLQVECEQQQQGALLYLAAVVGRAVTHGTTMTLSRQDMVDACDLILDRGDTPDGGLALRVIHGRTESEPETPNVRANRPSGAAQEGGQSGRFLRALAPDESQA